MANLIAVAQVYADANSNASTTSNEQRYPLSMQQSTRNHTGCSGIVVKKDLVSKDQFTGNFNVMLLIDNKARKVPIAKIDVDTPYLKGQVEAQCLPDPIYDLVVGKVML